MQEYLATLRHGAGGIRYSAVNYGAWVMSQLLTVTRRDLLTGYT